MNRQDYKENIRKLAKSHGFVICRFTSPQVDAKHQHAYANWIASGMHGEMSYMAEETRMERRNNPSMMLDDIKTVITVAMPCSPPPYMLEDIEHEKNKGVIATYAHGDDYHDVMKKHLKAFASNLDALLGEHDQRVYVDTAPVLEHALAESSGLGWQGKHTLTINRQHGSYLLLGELFTTAEIRPDEAAGFHCGSCTDCMDICPTKAIVAPFVVDATLCISYLTIEYKGFIPHSIRPLMGNRIFGCDDCQMTCPWNRKAEILVLDQLKPRDENILPTLSSLFRLDEDKFRDRFRKSPLKRAKRAGLLRNVAIAMGNSGNREYIPLLIQALDDTEPLIRGHSAWALGHLFPQSMNGEIMNQLTYHAQHETHTEVLDEFQAAINEIGE